MCLKNCRGNAIRFDKDKNLTINPHFCVYCGRCVAICPEKAIKVDESFWPRFQCALAISAKEVLKTFTKQNILHINIIMNITALCDCFGMGQPSIVQDIGIMFSKNISAIEKATLDKIGQKQLFENAMPGKRKFIQEEVHPFKKIWGKDPYVQITEAEKIGIGKSKYIIKKVI